MILIPLELDPSITRLDTNIRSEELTDIGNNPVNEYNYSWTPTTSLSSPSSSLTSYTDTFDLTMVDTIQFIREINRIIVLVIIP